MEKMFRRNQEGLWRDGNSRAWRNLKVALEKHAIKRSTDEILLRGLMPEQLATHPLRGNLFENLAVMEAYKREANQARDPRLFFYRTEKGFEIDLIRQEESKVFPCEIKSAMTYSKNLIANLEEYCRQEKAATCPRLVYDGTPLSGLGKSDTVAVNIRTGF